MTRFIGIPCLNYRLSYTQRQHSSLIRTKMKHIKVFWHVVYKLWTLEADARLVPSTFGFTFLSDESTAVNFNGVTNFN